MHFVHLGHVGLVMNIRWAELADFMLGWTTLDIGHDDGKLARNNPWPPESRAPAE